MYPHDWLGDPNSDPPGAWHFAFCIAMLVAFLLYCLWNP
jgi:hypothetical protein